MDQNGPLNDEEPLRLDADTGGEGELPYAVVYRPSIAPHKRSGARDLVRWDSSGAWLGVQDPTQQTVPLTPARSPEFDAYEGSLTIRARSNVPIPLPSVAPQMVIHAVRANPAVPVRITRDGTDIYYVEVPVDGEVQLTLSVSVDPRYASGGLHGLTPSRRAPSRVPPGFGPDAQAVIDAIGVPPDATDVETVALLVDWFSAFSATPPLDPPPAQQDLYRVLSLARAGVCRHRAQAFVLTAAALGVPARYVHNEAHAFVEVQFVEGWRRFDLGGDAAGLDLIGAPTDPANDPQPAPRDELGGPEDRGGRSTDERAAAESDSQPSQPAGAAHDETDAEQATRQETPTSSEHGTMEATPPTPATPTPTPTSHYEAEGLAIAPGEQARIGSRVTLALGEQRRYRREPVTIRGRLSGTTGDPIVDQPVVLLLRDAAGNEAPLGEVRTGERGEFVVVLPIPGAVPVGSWEVIARFSGNEHFEAAASAP